MKNLERTVLPNTTATASAGLITAPEYFPKDNMTTATTPAKVNAMKTRATSELRSGISEATTIEAGPIKTSAYVPRSSDKHSFLQVEHG